MPTTILATKLYVPPPRPKIVLRPRLIKRLNEGIASGGKLTLISAPAGFGKTTLVSEWVAALTFLLEHLPPRMHLVITSREDPTLPLARLRARGQMTELRLSDLRFTSSEALNFSTRRWT